MKIETKAPNKINDSIDVWIKALKNNSNSIEKRKRLLTKSYHAIKSSRIDSFQVKKLSALAYQNLKLGDTTLFKQRNKEALAIATRLKDTFVIGDVHWNYASYYNKIQVYDSAYYHFYLAYSYFKKNDNPYESAKTLYGMAYVKGRFKDYSGSEVLTFRAIEKFKSLKNYKSLFSCYNHLAQLQNDILEYDRALFYYNKALSYLDNIENNQVLYEAIQNNIANVFLEQKEYSKALNLYSKVLENNRLKSHDIYSYARVIDNKAYCKLLMKDTTGVVNDLKEALHIRDSLNNKEGVVISKIRLAHYYIYKKDTIKAVSLAKEANDLAKGIKNSRDYLESLLLLEKIDTKHSLLYLKKHISFNDSLQIVERKTQNKFTRIDYETDEYIEEAEQLTQQKTWIIITSIGLILILGLLYFINRQKSKNEKLILENEQQKSNEQLYLLTFRQQGKLEKEKIKERNRIAEELHDGILGKLFGTRVGLGFLDFEGSASLKEQYQSFLSQLQTIEKEIREVSHKLSDNFDDSKINFTNIIYQLLDSKSNIGNFKYELEFDEGINWQKVNEKIKVNLYRILQEAVLNSIKHASAKKIIISFKLDKKKLVLIIKDDGFGFNVKQKRKGIGLMNMKSRVEKLAGLFMIHSTLERGTTITIQIPI